MANQRLAGYTPPPEVLTPQSPGVIEDQCVWVPDTDAPYGALGGDAANAHPAYTYAGSPTLVTRGSGEQALASNGTGIIDLGVIDHNVYLVQGYQIHWRGEITDLGTWEGVFAYNASSTATSQVAIQRNSSTNELRLYHNLTAYTLSIDTTDLIDGNTHNISVHFQWDGSTSGTIYVAFDGTLVDTFSSVVLPEGSSPRRGPYLFTNRAVTTVSTGFCEYFECKTRYGPGLRSYDSTAFLAKNADVYVDWVAPVTGPQGTTTISSISPATDTTATVTYSYDDTDEDSFEYTLDGGSSWAAIGASPATISVGVNRWNKAQVRAINGSGNGTPSAEYRWSQTPFYAETQLIADGIMAGSDHHAIFHDSRLFMGVTDAAAGRSIVYRLQGSTLSSTVLFTAATKDVHNTPTVYVRSDGRVVALAAEQSVSTSVSVYTSDTAGDIDFASPVAVSFGTEVVSYWRLAIDPVSGDWFVFANTSSDAGVTRHVSYCRSTDSGATWGSPVRLYTAQSSRRSYTSISEVTGGIAVVINRDHPNDVSDGSCSSYFALFDGAADEWQDSTGTAYGTLPLTESTADVCFNSTTAGYNSDFFKPIVESGSDLIFYTNARKSAGAQNKIFACTLSGGSWSQVALPESEDVFSIEPVTASNSDPYSVFCCLKEQDGTLQVFRASTTDAWITATFDQLTTGSPTNDSKGYIRPIRGWTGDQDKQIVFGDLTRTSTTSYTATLYALFDSLLITNLETDAITTTSITPRFDYNKD